MNQSHRHRPLAVGSRVDSCIVENVLGRGGFGITYAVQDEAEGALFALKEFFPDGLVYRDADGDTIRNEPRCDEEYRWSRARFLEEARVLAQFRHPNIVGVHRVFEANGTVYMQLEFIPGRTLENWLREIASPPTQEELDLIAGPVLDALEHVHGNGVHHLDVSPENIMIASADGRPMLLDFGAARLDIKRHSQLLSAMVYKAGYSAPEQYAQAGSRLGPWTDIYALGATLYRAITGERPSEAPVRQIEDDYVAIASRAGASYRPGFLDAIDWSLRLHPSQRPQSISAWRSRLLGVGPEAGQPIPPPQSTQRAPLTLPADPASPYADPAAAAPLPVADMQAPPMSMRPRSPMVPIIAAAALLTGAGVTYALWPDSGDGIKSGGGGGSGGSGEGRRYSDLPERSEGQGRPQDKDGEGEPDKPPADDAPKSRKWGAVARRDASFTAHWNHNSKAEAREAALEACKKFDGDGQCDVVAAFTSQWCWALARGNKDRTRWNWSTGASIDAARDAAKAACDKRVRSDGGCEISLQFCSDGSNVFSDRK